jgi:hypothetical protein
MQRSEVGQTVPLLALVVLLAGAGCLFVAHVGAASLERGRARTAADAAALAGAAAGEFAARSAASANGGRLVSYEAAGTEARVRVEVDRAVASARARRSGSASSPGPVTGLTPALRAALARAEQLLGERVPVTSGFRSAHDQARLWANRWRNPYPVAPPGRSAHERGVAVDVPAVFTDRLASVAGRVGLCRPYPKTDPIHWELCGA